MIEFDFQAVYAGLERSIASLANQSPFLEEVWLIGKAAVQRRISESKQDADGKSWAGWTPSTAKARSRRGTASGGLLLDSGNLLRSISVSTTPGGVEIGAGASYAQYLNGGTRHMPSRPFVGWAPEDEALVANAFSAWIDRSFA